MKTDIKKNGLSGEIKQIKTDKFNATDRFGEIIQTTRTDFSFDHSLTKCDEKGNTIESNSYDIDGNLYSQCIFKYDNIGNNNEMNIYININSVLSLQEKEFYKYDQNIYNSDGLKERAIFKYDQKGNVIERNSYNSDGNLIFKFTYKYDDIGNQIEENHYSPDGSLTDKSIYIYDDKNNKIELNNYADVNSGITYKVTYKYNEKGNLIEENTIYTDNTFSFLNRKETYKYDDRGSVIEQTSYKEDGSVTSDTYKYEYDNKSNWIKKTQFKNGIVPIYITIRDITYTP